MFYDRFIKLCRAKGVKPTPLIVGMGLSSSNVSQWKKGSTPRPDVLQRIADYFGVSVEHFLTEEAPKEKPPAQGVELMEKYAMLSPENREAAQKYIDFLIAGQQNP